MLNIPLMADNIDSSDIDVLIDFLKTADRFTNGPKVREFEKKWSRWLGVRYSLFVGSGSSANFMTFAGIREIYGEGEVILSPIGWSSDISAVITAGLTPVFADVDLKTFALKEDEVIEKINEKTRAVLLTHVLGFNGMTRNLRDICRQKNILLVEDVCESHGAEFEGSKCGSLGDVSNFSFYYAHHMSTIEGGMICTDNEQFYNLMRMYRSHGMLRECDDRDYVDRVVAEHPELYPEFIFMVPGYNMRSTELNAVIGINQLKRLNDNIAKRQKNYKLFIENLDSQKYYTEFNIDGSSNYAFVIMCREANQKRYDRMVEKLKENNVEFRRGTAGGGNLLRQPFIRKRYPQIDPGNFKNAEYIHRYGLYTGNYPSLEEDKISKLCALLNAVD